jgi:hypothetical protein
MKEKSTKALRKKLWTIFSKYIRYRDKGVCISCQKQDDPEGKGLTGGHFVHDCMDFSELNINCQCSHCNYYLHGNLAKYAINLQKKIGADKVEWLLGQRHTVEKYSVGELELLIKHYKTKLEELKCQTK